MGLQDVLNDVLRKYPKELQSMMEGRAKLIVAYEKNKSLKAAEPKLKEIHQKNMETFYADYSPKNYDRNESLHELLDISMGNDFITVDYNPEKATRLRKGGNIYELVFKRGYHGGAGQGPNHPDVGTPYYRKPYPWLRYWGRPAVKMKNDTPYSLNLKDMDEYMEKVEKDYIQNVYRRYREMY